MDEIRAYVDHLFEGRPQTPENDNLKEQVYRDLVARYEGCIAQGMTEQQALEQAEAGITSIDGLGADTAYPAQTGNVQGYPAAGQAQGYSTDATIPMTAGNASETGAQPNGSGAQQPNGTDPDEAEKSAKRKRTIAMVIVAVVALVVGLLIGIWIGSEVIGGGRGEPGAGGQEFDGEMPEGEAPDGEAPEGEAPDGEAPEGGNGEAPDGEAPSESDDGDGADDDSDADTASLDDQIWSSSITGTPNSYGTVALGSDAVAKLVAGLPLGRYANGVSSDDSSSEVAVSYASVDDSLDGGSI